MTGIPFPLATFLVTVALLWGRKDQIVFKFSAYATYDKMRKIIIE